MTGKCVYFTMVILRLMILSLHLNYALPQSRIDTEAELPKTDKNTKSPFGVQSINRVSNVKIGSMNLPLIPQRKKEKLHYGADSWLKMAGLKKYKKNLPDYSLRTNASGEENFDYRRTAENYYNNTKMPQHRTFNIYSFENSKSASIFHHLMDDDKHRLRRHSIDAQLPEIWFENPIAAESELKVISEEVKKRASNEFLNQYLSTIPVSLANDVPKKTEGQNSLHIYNDKTGFPVENSDTSVFSPALGESTQRLLSAVQSAIRHLDHGMNVIYARNQYVFNVTRYHMILNVRRSLQEINKANAFVYRTGLQASRFAYDLLMQAYKERMTGRSTKMMSASPAILLRIPYMHNVSIDAFRTKQMTALTFMSVSQFSRKIKALQLRTSHLKRQFLDAFDRNSLRNLVHYLNSSIQKLHSELFYSISIAYARRNLAILSDCVTKIETSRGTLHKASRILSGVVHKYRVNRHILAKWINQKYVHVKLTTSEHVRSGNNHHYHSKLPESTDPLIHSEGRVHHSMSQTLRSHLRQQEHLASLVNWTLTPAMDQAKNLTRSFLVLLPAMMHSVVQLNTLGTKLFANLDLIRLLIGGEDKLDWQAINDYSKGCSEFMDESDDIEGSGCLTESIGDAITDTKDKVAGTFTNTDSADFIFDETNIDTYGDNDDDDDDTHQRRFSSMMQFGKQLSDYVVGIVQRSKKIVDNDELRQSIQGLLERWKEAQQAYITAKHVHLDSEHIKTSILNISTVMQEMRGHAAVVENKANSISARVEKALEIIQYNLEKKMQGRHSHVDSVYDNQTLSDETVSEAVSAKVQEWSMHMDSVKSLMLLTLKSCDHASSRLVYLQSNVSALQKRVTYARRLLQSMRLSMSKSAGEFFSIPLVSPLALVNSVSLMSSKDADNQSMVTSVDVCILTEGMDGAILFVKGSNSVSYGFTIYNKQLKLTVYDAKDDIMEIVTSDATLDENTWYHVRMIRTGEVISVLVFPKDINVNALVRNNMTVSGLPVQQPQPLHVYVGGVTSRETLKFGLNTWKGCLSDLFINKRYVSLMGTSQSKEPPHLCPQQCSVSGENRSSFVFDGAGGLRFHDFMTPLHHEQQSLSFLFRTWQMSVALFQLVNESQSFALRAMLDGGGMVIQIATSSTVIMLTSRAVNYNDATFHRLSLTISEDTISAELDGNDEVFSVETSRRQPEKMANGIYFGAFINENYTFVNSLFRPLIGCIYEVKINEKVLLWPEVIESHGVDIGLCDLTSEWAGCIKFHSNSSGINFGSLTFSKTIHLLFSELSSGPMLIYAREQKFHVTVFSTEDGLLISSDEMDREIAKPGISTDRLALLTVNDDGKMLTFSAWGKVEFITYVGFFRWRTYVDGSHVIQIAMASNSAKQNRFIGQISQLMIGDRFIDLDTYRDAHGLLTCDRPLPELVRLGTEPEASHGHNGGLTTCTGVASC